MQDTILRLCASTALVGALALPASAQQIINLEEVTFSANLVPVPIQRSGASVSVVTTTEIEQTGASAPLSDVLRRLPGVTVTQAGPTGTSTILRIRGAAPRFTSVFVDGILVDDPTGLSTQFDFGTVGTTDVERVEVLRGSQSALYGGSAVAGVVNITSQQPTRDGFSQTARAEIGSYNTVSMAYGLFFRDDRLDMALNLARRQSDGFSAWEGPLPAPKGLERDGFESNRISFSARYRLTDDLTVGLNAFAQRAVTEYDGYGNASAENESRRREAGGRVFAAYDLGTTQHELSLSHYNITRREFAAGNPDGWFKGGRTTLKYQGQAQISDDLTVIWGADTMQERGEFDASLAGQSKMRTSGLYGQVLWSDARGLDLSASLRVDNISDFGNFVTGRLAAAYAVSDSVTLRGAIGRGFTAPSINQRFGANYGVFTVVAPNTDLSPETSLSYELGADLRLGDATLSATVFQLNTDNAIEWCGNFTTACDAPLPAGFTNSYQNVEGKTRRRGLELDVLVPVNERVQISGTYTYLNTRTPSGDRVSRIPRHEAGLSVQAMLSDSLQGTASLRHVSGRPNDSDFTVWPADSVEMPAYTVYDLNFRYQVNEQADLTLRIENLFNKQYQTEWGYGTSGRSVYLGVAARF